MIENLIRQAAGLEPVAQPRIKRHIRAGFTDIAARVMHELAIGLSLITYR